MEPSATLPTAIAATALGFTLLGLVWLGLRLAARSQAWSAVRVASPVTLPLERGAAEAAVLLADPGGRLRFINDRARELFEVGGSTPNLWQLLRKAQPANALEALFVKEGRTSLNIGDQHVEATSLRVSQADAPAQFVIVLQETGVNERVDLDLADPAARSTQALNFLTELSRALSANLDLTATFDAILNSLGRVFQFNSAEITLWDEAEQGLRPVRHIGRRDYDQELARAGYTVYRPGQGFSGWLAAHRTPLLVNDIQTFTLARPLLPNTDFPARAYLGVPMLIGDRLIGTLEMMSFKVGAYRQGDEALLALIAGQAATALQTAKRFAEQQQNMLELKALTDITRAIESTADPHELYARLTADIARFMDAQIVGLLLFDPAQNMLVSQPPFHGIPDIVSVLYQILIPSGSAVERLWQANQVWLSNSVADDPDIDATGLRQVAEAVGIRTSLLAPISVGGRKVGAIHLCNKARGAAPFTEEDARLLLTFAGQAAAILDNARLVGEAKVRAEQAEGLREIATALASSTNLDEVLRTAMRQSAALLHFDVGYIALLDEARGELAPHPASLYGAPVDKAPLARFMTHDADYAQSVTRQRRTWLIGSLLRDELNEGAQLISGAYRKALEQLKLESAMAVPLVVGDRCLGEMLVGARREDAFGRADLQLLITLAAQLATGVERVRLYASTDEDLRRRVEQLTALSRVSREINQTLVLESLLQVVYEESKRVTHADCGTIVLLAPPNPAMPLRDVELRIGDDELGRQLTPLEEELVAAAQWSGAQAPLEPRRVSDLPEASALAAHAGIRSALIVPIVAGGVLAGFIHLHSLQPAGFDEAAAEITGALAAQTAIAVSNAQRFEEQKRRGRLLSRRADQLGQLLQISRTVRSNLPLATNLEIVAAGIWESVGFNAILISVLDPQTKRLRRMASAGVPLETFERIKKVEQPWENVARLFRPEFSISRSYFMPHEQVDAAALVDIVPTPNAPAPLDVPNAWHPDDLFLVPLIGSNDEPVGLLALDDPVEGFRPDRSMAEIAEIFANQAALVIENARLYQASERRAARLLALHRVMEQANRVADRGQRWQAMAEALLGELGLDVCLIAMVDFASQAIDPTHVSFILQGKAGNISSGIDFAPMFMTMLSAAPEAQGAGEGRADKALDLSHVTYAPRLVLDVPNSTLWATDPLILATQVTAFATAPIESEGKLAGLLFAGTRTWPSPFAPEDLDLFITLANQLGAALESARLEAQALAERSQRAAQLTALSEVSRLIMAALRTDDVVRIVKENLGRVIPYDSATLWLRAGRPKTQQLKIVAAQGFENNAERVGLTVDIADSALFAEMARTGGAIIVPDVRADTRFPGAAFLPTRSWLGAPLVSKSQILGALVLDKVEVDAYTPQVAQVLMAFANQTAIALENARLFEESEQRTAELNERSQRLALLNRISTQLSSTLNEHRLYEVALTEVALALNVPQAAIIAFDDEGRTSVAVQLPVYNPLPAGYDQTQVIMRVYGTLKPVVIEDVNQDLLLTKARAIFAERGVKSLLVLPMAVAGTPVAAMQLEETAARRFTPGEVELAQTLANQAAVAVQNARLYNESQARLNELATLNRISHALASTINLEQVYQTMQTEILPVMGVDSIYLALYDENTDLVSFPFIVQKGELLDLPPQIPGGLTGRILQTRQPLLLRGDLYAVQSQLQKLGARQVGEGVARSYLGVPLIIGERILGVLAVQDLERTDVFTPTHERLLTIIAAQAAVTVENARFAQELEARVAARTQDLDRARVRMETLLNITTELSASLDLELVLARTLELVTASVKAPQGSIYLIDDNNPSRLIYRAALGRPKPLRPGGEPSPFKRNEGLIGWVIRNRQGTLSGDVENDPRWTRLPNRPPTQAKSALAVPLMMGEEVQGGMILLSPQPNAFDEDQLRLVAAAANQVGAAINNAKLYKMIEDLNRETGQALREQMVEASKSRSILEGIADGVMVTDDRGVVILFNVACERILGLKRGQVVGQPATNFVGIYGAAGQTWLEAITKWTRDPSGYAMGDFFSEQVTLDNKRIISVHLAPVATGKEYLGSVSVIRDITREVEVDRLKSEFVTNVSHELRTPMSAIKGYADILLMGAGGPLAPQQTKFLEVIKNNADRLGVLLNDLLDISRIESGRVELAKQPLDIREVLKAVANALQARIAQQSKPMQVVVNAAEDLPLVPGDRQRVTQLILALAENAFYYSEANGTIQLTARVEGTALEVEVCDTGIGMSPEEQKRLFDRFYRGENPLVLKTPGNGLGLAMARQLAEMHGGKAWLVKSEVGQGSTFAVSLPLG